MVRFIHAADIHLDSRLIGLERYEGAPVDEIRGATRQALAKLVDLAIEESVAFLLIAGDVYDGDWRDCKTAVAFHSAMSRLREAGIPVFCISGNHDADSQVSRSLPPPEGLEFFPTDRPATRVLEDIGVAIHGQGYSKREITQDLSAAYPAPVAGCLNIGLLHTSADGREGHANYAPCSVEGLASKGYDYWALGHIHQREILSEEPWVVFPGNLQGRHIRETGAKGCSLVTISDGRVTEVEHRSVDVLRWARCRVDASGAEDVDEVMHRIGERLREEIASADGRTLAVRIEVDGVTKAHAEIARFRDRLRDQIRMAAFDIDANRLWIERIEWRTRVEPSATSSGSSVLRQRDFAEGAAPFVDAEETGFEGIQSIVNDLRHCDEKLLEFASSLDPLRRKLPHEATEIESGVDLSDPATLRSILEEAKDSVLFRLSEENS